jgi:hypothetical protein
MRNPRTPAIVTNYSERRRHEFCTSVKAEFIFGVSSLRVFAITRPVIIGN